MKLVQEFNEFTWDMVRSLPFCYYYHFNKIDYQLEHKLNLSSLYYFVKNKKEINKFNDKNPHDTYCYEGPPFIRKNWLPPPIKKDFQGVLNFQKPTLIVNNKYTKEWGRPPKNFLSIQILDYIFSQYKNKYQILYIRPLNTNSKDYYVDENEILKFNDYELIKNKHPEVITIYDVLNNHADLSFNTAQFAMHATSSKHISVSGGNACLSAYFSGDLIIYDAGHKSNKSRPIWTSNSWLSKLSGSNIIGVHSNEQLKNILNEKFYME